MNTTSDKEIPVDLPWWLRLCCYLWQKLRSVWGIVITLIEGIIVILLTNPSGIVTDSPLAWLVQPQHILITRTIGIGLLVLTGVIGMGNVIGTRLTAVQITPEQSHRACFLARLNRRYTDLLEQSLQGATFIALGLAKQSAAALHATRLSIKSPITSEHLLPAGTALSQAYDEANEELLILGAPGAGKTTLLLNLAQELLARAKEDEQQLIPVIFPLSSWAIKQQPLGGWLIEELRLRYDVPRRLSQTWVQNEQILPLLDGLDEVPSSACEACINAINVYHREHLVPLVVSCRKTEYLALHKHLSLASTITVQPLRKQQVESYLEAVGEPLAALRHVLQKNPVLYELATTPLILNVLTLAYHEVSVESLPKIGTSQEQQQQVFASYVQRMLEQPGSYKPQQIQEGLTRLAQCLRQCNRAVLYLEHLQSYWLASTQRERIYNWLVIRLPDVLIGALFSLTISLFFSFYDFPDIIRAALMGGLLGGILSAALRSTTKREETKNASWQPSFQELMVGILIGIGIGWSFGEAMSKPIYGVILGMGYGICSNLLQVLVRKRNMVEVPSQISSSVWRNIWQYLARSVEVRNGLLIGLFIGSIGMLTATLSDWYYFAQTYGQSIGVLQHGLEDGVVDGITNLLIYGLTGGFLTVLLMGGSIGVLPTDRLVWSWKQLRRGLLLKYHIRVTLGIIILFELLMGLSVWFYSSDRRMLTIGLIVGLLYWLLFGLFQGVSGETIEDQKRMVPNQGIRRSAFNGLVMGLISAIITGFIITIIDGLYYWLSTHNLASDFYSSLLSIWLYVELSIGLSIGLLVGLLMGGLVCLRHYSLRFLLWRAGLIPWRYPEFLDEAARRILLRKEGAGYTFIHSLLQDYFAGLAPEPTSSGTTECKPDNLPLQSTPGISAEIAEKHAHLDEPTVPLTDTQTRSMHLLPCGHEWQSNARFCSMCGAPLPHNL